jgi:uncharacterized protein YneF (UPF0154 family)
MFLERRYIEKTLAALPPLPELKSMGRQLSEYLKESSR